MGDRGTSGGTPTGRGAGLGDSGGGPALAVRIAETATWFLLLVGAYLVFISEVTPLEGAVGCLVALVGAGAAAQTRRAERLTYRPALRWLRWVVPLPSAIVTDTAWLLRRLVRQVAGRQPGGQFVDLPLPTAHAGQASTQRAVAMLLLSMPPGSYVVGSTPDGRVVRIHQLTSGRRTPAVGP